MDTSGIYNQEDKKVVSDKFWSEQPSILYDGNRIIEFVPTSDMSIGEQLNAISRFCIYISVILLLIYHNYNLLYIGIIGCIIMYMIYYNYRKNQITEEEQFKDKVKKDLEINPNTQIKITESGDICQKPTPNNPFMNVLMTDYTDDPHRPPACPYNDNMTNEERDKYFNYNLYKDVTDVWDRRNAQREFITMPNTTIPNDRDSFMNWCWRTTYVCKDGDLKYCLQNEDLRVPGFS